MIENTQINEILEILEEMADEELATSLLAEFNAKSKKAGTLILNQDPNLDHEDWKAQCDQAQSELDEVIQRIKGHGE